MFIIVETNYSNFDTTIEKYKTKEEVEKFKLEWLSWHLDKLIDDEKQVDYIFKIIIESFDTDDNTSYYYHYDKINKTWNLETENYNNLYKIRINAESRNVTINNKNHFVADETKDGYPDAGILIEEI